jgi:hypothetical protein
VVGKDRGQRRFDFAGAVHFAAVEPDRVTVVLEQAREGAGVASVPALEQRAVHTLDRSLVGSQAD